MHNYNIIQKFLHDLVLSNKIINKSLFEIEKIIYLNNRDISDQSHVFITGMPRSGTTSILNFLFLSDNYASLIYKNLPFVLSPNICKLFYKNNFVKKKERIHGDGLYYDLNSPEAFDEIFFHMGKEFARDELLNFFQLVCLSQNKKKYLSKNNLNYKRIDLIKSVLPKSLFLITVREPLQHAYSLLNQHLRFSKLQKKDHFIRRYMNYLGHNEFGLDHKPWNDIIKYHDSNKIDYWLEQWSLFYQNILDNFQSYKDCHFIIYEELTNFNYIKKLLEKINIEKVNILDFDYFKNSNKKKINIKYDEINYTKANLIYKRFFELK